MNANLPQQWLDKAAEDLTVARLVLKEGHTAHGCFLAQQCIEKSLKAYLLAKVNIYPRTHKLVDLLGESEKVEPTLARFLSDCLIIDQYYIPTRYPDGIPGGTAGGVPTQAEATEATEIAAQILHFVTSQL
jgi:HEPN domain-containing protein